MTTRKPADAESLERLKALTEAARNARLTPAEEDEAMRLLGETVASGKAGLSSAAEYAPLLPWNIAVKGVSEAWSGLKPLARKQFVAALAAQTSENGRRCRLSLARGLVAQDLETAARLAGGVCAEIKAENAALTPRDRQIFSNVFIGKGKPWLTHFATLADWAEADAAALVDCAVQACFHGSCPPFTQSALLRWIVSVGHLDKLPPDAVDVVAKAVKRWPPKFQKELSGLVPTLPAAIGEALSAAPAAPDQRPPKPETEPLPPRREQAPAPSRQSTRREPQEFDLQQALRQIDTHVKSLQRELQDARSAARRGENNQSRRGSFRERASSATSGAGEAVRPEEHEALQRHSARLEETVAELRHQLEEITSHHEDVATSRAVAEGNPDSGAELKALLGLKLRNDFAEFEALRGESATDVLRLHYREMLDHVFQILANEGVPLTEPAMP